MKIMPLKTRLLSTRDLPWDLGKQRSSLAICDALSQYRSRMSFLHFGRSGSYSKPKINASRVRTH